MLGKGQRSQGPSPFRGLNPAMFSRPDWRLQSAEDSTLGNQTTWTVGEYAS